MVSGRRRTAPYGMAGGEPGRTGRNYVVRVDGSVEELAGSDRSELVSGDLFVIETPGGGGYGKP
jgi:5-oxoprolinase (ATP-hydrolysing)